MSIEKYAGAWTGDGNQPLHWIRESGLPPLRGVSGGQGLTEEAMDRLFIARDFRCKLFQLWIPEHQVEYIQVRDCIINGLFRLEYIERHFSPAHGHFWIYLEWGQQYSQLAAPLRVDSPLNRGPVAYSFQGR